METKGYQNSLVKISKVGKASVGQEPLQLGDVLESDELRLTYAGYDNTISSSKLQFTLLNKALNKTEKMSVGMGFYYSYRHFNQFYDNGQNSGDYIFRPRTG